LPRARFKTPSFFSENYRGRIITKKNKDILTKRSRPSPTQSFSSKEFWRRAETGGMKNATKSIAGQGARQTQWTRSHTYVRAEGCPRHHDTLHLTRGGLINAKTPEVSAHGGRKEGVSSWKNAAHRFLRHPRERNKGHKVFRPYASDGLHFLGTWLSQGTEVSCPRIRCENFGGKTGKGEVSVFVLQESGPNFSGLRFSLALLNMEKVCGRGRLRNRNFLQKDLKNERSPGGRVVRRGARPCVASQWDRLSRQSGRVVKKNPQEA